MIGQTTINEVLKRSETDRTEESLREWREVILANSEDVCACQCLSNFLTSCIKVACGEFVIESPGVARGQALTLSCPGRVVDKVEVGIIEMARDAPPGISFEMAKVETPPWKVLVIQPVLHGRRGRSKHVD